MKICYSFFNLLQICLILELNTYQNVELTVLLWIETKDGTMVEKSKENYPMIYCFISELNKKLIRYLL